MINLYEDYPKNFLMDEFQSIPSFLGKKRYADERLKRISSGSARIVYQIDDKKVLKIAKNKKGLAQNSIEGEPGIQQYNSVARVFDIDNVNPYPFWVEMELAIPLSRRQKRFENLIQCDTEELYTYFLYIDSLRGTSKYHPSISNDLKEKMNENEWVGDIVILATDYDMPLSGDLIRTSSYGEVKRNGVPTAVLIDFGLTNDVYKQHYGSESKKPQYYL
jgi:hypothetical protein